VHVEQSDQQGYPPVTNSFSGHAASAFVLVCSSMCIVAHLFVKSKQGTPAGVVLSSRRLKTDGSPERIFDDIDDGIDNSTQAHYHFRPCAGCGLPAFRL